MSVFNPYAGHYQAAWDNRAANHHLPLWVRIVCIAYGRHKANGHAVFGRGDLTWILGTPRQATANHSSGPIARPSETPSPQR